MPKYHKRYYRKKLLRKFLLIAVLVILVIGGLFYLLFLSPIFKVKEIKIDSEKLKSDPIKAIAREYIFKKLVLFYPKTLFWLDFKTANTKIKRAFPKVESVKFKRDWPSKIVLKIKERQKVGVFSGTGESFSFLIDGKGVIFEKIESKAQSDLIIESHRTDFELGDQVVAPKMIKKILRIKNALDLLKIKTKYFKVPSGSDQLNIKTHTGWEIYFSTVQDLDWQITKLKLALDKKIPPEKRGELEYIDLRFGNKVYPKYR